MNDVVKVITSAIRTAHLFFSLQHFRADDKLQIYYTYAQGTLLQGTLTEVEGAVQLTSLY
jgi:hypothetical protein